MSYKHCPTIPKATRLAIKDPSMNLYAHLPVINKHHGDWAEIERATAISKDTVRQEIAHMFHKEFFESTALFKFPFAAEYNPRLLERDRRRALGALGMSILMRQIIQPADELNDARLIGAVPVDGDIQGIILDMMAGPDGMPLDPRVHTTHENAQKLLGDWPDEDATDNWYYDGNLYVNRTRLPAHPTDELVAMFQDSIELNFAEMETLLPYVPNV